MALLFMDGFDHYASADITKKWDYTYLSFSYIDATAGRRGGGAMHGIYNYGEVRRDIVETDEVVVGFALKPEYDQTDVGVIWLAEGANGHVIVKLFSPFLKVYKGSTLLGTGVISIPSNAWSYIEVRAVISDTTGVVQVKVNGTLDSGLNLSGVNTRNGGTGVVSTITLGASSGASMDGWYDDLYVCDASGSVNNTFLGDCRVDVVFPEADGYYTAFDPSTGTTHYTLVDDLAPNALDYVSTATDGVRDSYGFSDLEALSPSSVRGVQVTVAGQKSDSGSAQIVMFSRVSSTDADGAAQNLATTQSIKTQVFETTPASSAWTQSTVDSAQFGVKAVIA